MSSAFLDSFDRGLSVTPPPAGAELVIAVDTMVLGTHFTEATAPCDLGYKILAVNLSDLAAMGAEPLGALLCISAQTLEPAWLEAFGDGFSTLAANYAIERFSSVRTSGGHALTVQVYGFVPEHGACLRSGAQPGDSVLVTGTLGDAGAALSAARGELELAAHYHDHFSTKLARPQPRVAEGMAMRPLASSAIDLSDGLASDLSHVLEASGVGATLHLDQLPLSAAMSQIEPPRSWQYALSSGDDYELCITCPPRNAELLIERVERIGTRISCIGQVDPMRGLRCQTPDGSELTPAAGYQHFS